jgi:hypothetical protein
MTTEPEDGLILHDGRQLPATPDLRRTLALGLDNMLTLGYERRGGPEVSKPEDAYPLLRDLGGLSERARDYSRAFADFARTVEAAAGDDLIEMYGEQDGIPNEGAKVPDLDGTTLDIKPDYLNEYAFDTSALIQAAVASLLEQPDFRTLVGKMFAAEFAGDAQRSVEVLTDVMTAAVVNMLALGKFSPQVTKTRALAKTLSTFGLDAVASTITGATEKTIKHKGTKVTRVQPKEAKNDGD